MTGETDELLRRYARGEVTVRTLRDAGLDYSEVLTGLGELGLRPPTASLDGINGPALRRGMALVIGAIVEHDAGNAADREPAHFRTAGEAILGF